MSLYNVWVIAKREFVSYFNSAIAYIVVGAFLVFVNFLYFFMAGPFDNGVADVRSLFWFAAVASSVFVPAITMRLLAEEFSKKTIELLVSYPVSKLDIVAAKFLGAWALYIVMVLLSATTPLSLERVADLDWGPIVGAYAGLVFLGAVYISIGLLFSTLTNSQLVAIILSVLASMALSVGFWAVGMFLKGDVAEIVGNISVLSHFENMGRGVIDTRDLLYFASLTSFFLALAVYVLDREAA